MKPSATALKIAQEIRAKYHTGDTDEIVAAIIDAGLAEAVAFIRSIESSWDCDSGADGAHPSYCRCCRAKELLAKLV